MRLLLLLSALLGALTGGVHGVRLPGARSEVVRAMAVVRPAARNVAVAALQPALPTPAAVGARAIGFNMVAAPPVAAALATERLLV